jgi:hypothetical protein
MNTRYDWLNAANIFHDNIDAEILCPNCKRSNLHVIDIPFDTKYIEKGGERCLKCLNCNATEFILYRKPPKNWSANNAVQIPP